MGKLTHTVSGSIASFKSPDKSPIESLKVHFTPIQSGSGDPSPTNVRPITGWTGVTGYHTGKNLIYPTEYNGQFFNVSSDIDLKNGTTERVSYSKSGNTFTITTTHEWYGCIFATDLLQPGDYTIHTELSGSDVRRSAYVTDENLITKERYSLTSDNRTITLTEKSRIVVTISIQVVGTGSVSNLQVELGGAYTSYEDYHSSIIPVTIPAGGKNLLDLTSGNDIYYHGGSGYGNYTISNGSIIASPKTLMGIKVKCRPLTTYTFSYSSTYVGNNMAMRVYGCDNEPSQIDDLSNMIINAFNLSDPKRSFTTGENIEWLVVGVYVDNNVTGSITISNIQLELGSTATAYEPYTNIMYGGYVDLVTGNVVAEYIRNVYDGSEDELWEKVSSGSATAFGMTIIASNKDTYVASDIRSNYLKFIKNNSIWGNYDNWISETTSNITTGIQSITTVEAWREYLSEHNLIVCYKLKYSKVIATLTPTDLRAFIGANNIWSNANGNVECTYELKDHLLKKRRTFMRDHKVTTTSAPIANFKSGIKGGILDSCIVDFSPVQSGTDDPSPTNVRPISGWTGIKLVQHGENLLSINRTTSQNTQGIVYTPIQQNNKTVAIHVAGTRTNTNPFFNLNYVNGTTISIAPGTYKISGGTSEVWIQVFYKDSEGTECIAGYDNGSGATVSVPNDATCSWCRLLVKVDTKVDAYIYPIITSTDAVITTTPITFPVLGANKFNGVWEQGNVAAGHNEPSTTALRTGFINVDPSTSYYAYTTRTEKVFLFEYDENGTYLNIVTNISNGKSLTTSATTKKVRIADRNSGTESVNTGINYPATVTTYKPYTTTAYGGTLDLTTGVLTVELGIANLGDFNYQEYGSTETLTQYCSNSLDVLAKDYSNCISNIFKRTYSKVEWSVRCSNDAWKFYVCTGKDTYENVNALKSALAEAGAVIVYELATSVTYQLTPVQLKTLLGTNNIWADTNGNTTVTYWTR